MNPFLMHDESTNHRPGKLPVALEAALAYCAQGWSVIPIRDKKPCLLEWKPFQLHRSNERAIHWWFEHQCPDAWVAVICGRVSGNLAVLDIDDPCLAERLIQDGLDKTTRLVRTPSGGAHLYLKETQAHSRSRPLISNVADLKAEGGYIVVPPTPHYTLVSDGPILEVPDALVWSVALLAKYGIGVDAAVLDAAHERTRAYEALKARPLHEGERNHILTSYAGHLFREGWSVEEVEVALTVMNAKRCDPPLPTEEVHTIIQSVSRYPTTASATRPSEKPCYSASFEGLVDLVEHEGAVAFLVKEDEQLLLLPEVERDGQRFIPPSKAQIKWLLPRGEEVLRYYHADHDANLYDALLAYHKGISELPSEAHYDLLTLWVFHTYLTEAFQYSPIIWLFSVPDRGKSRTGLGMIYAAYRGVSQVSLREANFLRLASHWNASVFFDISDLWKKVLQNQSEDVLLHRFERGGIVSRVMFPDRGPFKDTVDYTVFGPTVIATNRGVPEALQTRTLQITMPDSSQAFDDEVTPEAGQPLRERLVAFRARHLGNSLPNIAKPAARRLGDILRPLHQIIRLVRPEREAVFLRLARSFEADRLTDKADSHDAHVLEAMLGLSEAVSKGFLAVKKITEAYNAGRPEREHLSTNTMGWRLKAMGFKKEKSRDGAMIVWDDAQIRRLCQAYGVDGLFAASEASAQVNGRGEHWTNPLERQRGPI